MISPLLSGAACGSNAPIVTPTHTHTSSPAPVKERVYSTTLSALARITLSSQLQRQSIHHSITASTSLRKVIQYHQKHCMLGCT